MIKNSIIALLLIAIVSLLWYVLSSRSTYVRVEVEGDVSTSTVSVEEDSEAVSPGVPASTEADTEQRFAELLEARVVSDMGQPIEGFEPRMFLSVFPSLEASDFDVVAAQQGSYTFSSGSLTYVPNNEPQHSAGPAITSAGMGTLLRTVSTRMGHPIDTTYDIDRLVGLLAHGQGEFR